MFFLSELYTPPSGYMVARRRAIPNMGLLIALITIVSVQPMHALLPFNSFSLAQSHRLIYLHPRCPHEDGSVPDNLPMFAPFPVRRVGPLISLSSCAPQPFSSCSVSAAAASKYILGPTLAPGECESLHDRLTSAYYARLCIYTEALS